MRKTIRKSFFGSDVLRIPFPLVMLLNVLVNGSAFCAFGFSCVGFWLSLLCRFLFSEFVIMVVGIVSAVGFCGFRGIGFTSIVVG